MTTVIYKYPIEVTDRQIVSAPAAAKWRFVALQHGRITVWAEVDPTAPEIGHIFHIYGTGHPILTSDLNFIGSIMDGAFVWHIYVEGPLSQASRP